MCTPFVEEQMHDHAPLRRPMREVAAVNLFEQGLRGAHVLAHQVLQRAVRRPSQREALRLAELPHAPRCCPTGRLCRLPVAVQGLRHCHLGMTRRTMS